MHLVHVLLDALHQVSNGHTDGPGGVALQLDHLVGTEEQRAEVRHAGSDPQQRLETLGLSLTTPSISARG